MDEEFDIDAGVGAIASDMGWESEEVDTEIIDEPEEEIDELQEAETAEEVTEPTTKAPPASWAKDKHDVWQGMTPEAQEYYELREKQMLDGIEQYKQGHQFASAIQQTIAPFREMLQTHGVNEVEAISNLFQWNQALQSGTLEQRQQALIALGNDLGLIPREGQPQIDPRTQELQQRLDRIERQEKQREQQAYQQNYQKVATEVEAFAADPAHEHFEDVADDVILLLKTGVDLKEAYEKAVWANPITRAKEQARLIEAEAKKLSGKNTLEAKSAIKAKSTNVRPVRSNKTSEAPLGSMEDTMLETLKALRG